LKLAVPSVLLKHASIGNPRTHDLRFGFGVQEEPFMSFEAEMVQGVGFNSIRRSKMTKTYWLMVFGLLMATILTGGCGSTEGGSSSGDTLEPLVLGVLSMDTGNTSFRQTVAMQDSDTNEYFPGQANVWDINNDFSLSSGGDDQFDVAMELSVDGIFFPAQVYADLTFYTPTVSTAEGIKVAAVVDGVEPNINNNGTAAIGGIYSVYLNDIHDGRLYQEVDLSDAVGAVELAWSWDVNVDDGNMGMPASLKAVIRDPAGISLPQTLQTVSSNDSNSYTANLSDYAGSSIIVSFEISSNSYGPNLIDDISVTDAGATEFIVNGDFETGNLAGWEINAPDELQNMTCGEETPVTLEGLTVTRSFYTVPDKLWGRWVDVFKNETAAAISVTVHYDADLGSDGAGILYETPETAGMSLSGWDGEEQVDPANPASSSNDRDFAFVFGMVDNLVFESATDIDVYDGNADIDHEYNITVAPGETVAIVNFVVMNGVDTGVTAADEFARATGIDLAAQAIVNDFWDDSQYRTGMTQDQIDAILNF
jgi:hypothetical protein